MTTRAKTYLILAGITAASVAALASAFGVNFDGWRKDEIAILESLRLSQLEPAPQDSSNAYETSRAAADLGQRIFFDKRFSANGAVSCASCHDPKAQFQDGRPLGQGVGTGARRTMPVVEAGRSPFLFWDGRKDSLWSQALGPLEDVAEHGGSRLAYVRLMHAAYRPDYEAIFGAMPELDGLPKDAGPTGTPAEVSAWKALPEKKRDDISRVFANLGKALAAYQKTLQYGESRLDRYLEGVARRDESARTILSEREKHGLRIFIGKGSCVSCHNGPLLTDQHFHNTGVAPRQAGRPDLGRFAAIDMLRKDEFNCLGRYSDAKPEQCEELNFMAGAGHDMKAAFKTPSLRNVALRPPYMHAGQMASLREVVLHYAKAPRSAAGHSELKPIPLSDTEIDDLVAFLNTLSGPIVQRPLTTARKTSASNAH